MVLCGAYQVVLQQTRASRIPLPAKSMPCAKFYHAHLPNKCYEPFLLLRDLEVHFRAALLPGVSPSPFLAHHPTHRVSAFPFAFRLLSAQEYIRCS